MQRMKWECEAHIDPISTVTDIEGKILKAAVNACGLCSFFSIPPLIIFPLGVERAAAKAQA